MKKSFMLLPLFAFALSGCNSNSSAENTTAEVSEANTAWQTEIQPTEMPSSMNQPTYGVNHSYPQPQPLPQPSYGGQTEMVGNCQVVREGKTPIYSQIQKGCYTGATYTVGKQDTLFLISYLAGKDVNEVARLNNLSVPYQLKVGQVLRLR